MSTTAYSKLEADNKFANQNNFEQLKEEVEGIASGTGGKAYPSLTLAMAVTPLPENGVVFTIDSSNESEKGVYAYDSTEPNGYRFVNELLKSTDEINSSSEVLQSKAVLPLSEKVNFILDDDFEEISDTTTKNTATSNFGTSANARAWGFPIGYYENVIGFKFPTTVNSPITALRVVIKENEFEGDIIAEKTFTVDYQNGLRTIEINFPEIENVSGNLWVEIRANGSMNVNRISPAIYFTDALGFPTPRYSTETNINLNTFTNISSSHYDIKLEVFYKEITAKFSEQGISAIEKVIENTDISNFPESLIEGSEKANDILKYVEIESDFISSFTDGVGAQGGNLYGMGFPIGEIPNLKQLKIPIYINASESPLATSITAKIKSINKDGALVTTKTFSLPSTPSTGRYDVIIDFDSIIPNTERLYLELFSSGKFGSYRRYPNAASIFTLANGYPPMALSTASSAITTGVLNNSANYFDFYFESKTVNTELQLTDLGVEVISGNSNDVTENIPEQNEKYSLVGSSVTWGDGYLQSGYVKNLIEKMQGRASVILPSIFQGTKIENRKYFKGQILELGLNDEIEFELTGNEISIVQSIDRVNTNSSEIEMYIDGELYSKFNNFNPSEIGSENKNFVGDGESLMFDLGRAFTYNHLITLNGASQVVTQNVNQGTNFTIPTLSNCAIIRRLGQREDGSTAVNHWLWFKVAPTNGASIAINYSYGEEINYEKSTIGKNTVGVNESPYGDGDVSFDPLLPASVSSGLDFRQTDERAVNTWRFTESKKRLIKLKVSGTYQSVGTPYFRFNLATNRYFHFQNAGIGGWQLQRLLNPISTEPTRNWQNVLKFNPDKVLVETTPNDDWTVFGYKVFKENTVDLATLRKIKTFPLRQITYNSGTDNYTFSKWCAEITEITRNSVSFDGSLNGTIEKGNVLRIGQYWSNNKDYIERVVESFDSITNTITFNKPIEDLEIIYNEISDFIGKDLSIRDLVIFTNNLENLIEKFSENTNAKISVLENPMPNILARDLWGYPDAINQIVNQYKLSSHVNYKSLRQWQESQPMTSVNVNVSSATTDAYLGLKVIEFGTAGQNLICTDILQNGVSIYGKKAVIENGWAYVPDPSLSGVSLNKTPTVRTDNKQSNSAVKPRVIIFDEALAGELEIKYVVNKWSSDSCHMNTGFGEQLYSQFINFK